jgi:hypothetical protein
MDPYAFPYDQIFVALCICLSVENPEKEITDLNVNPYLIPEGFAGNAKGYS